MRKVRTTGKPRKAYRTPKKVREYQKRYYELHRVERAKYYQKNKEKIIAYQQERYQKHKKEIRAYLKSYYRKNREEILAAQKKKGKTALKPKKAIAPKKRAVPKTVKERGRELRLLIYREKSQWKLHTQPVNGTKKRLPKAVQQGTVFTIEVPA